MKKRTVYWIPGINAGVVLSAWMMLCAVITRMVWACWETLSASVVWLQVVLPLTAGLSFLIILFRDGKERLFRIAIPVWLGCVFFALKAFTFDSKVHMVLCLLLYAVVAGLFTWTVTGYIPTALPLALLFGGAMAYHIFVEDLPRIGVWDVNQWLPELSVLCIMASLISLSLTMRRRQTEDGRYIRRFGDRNDGRRLRSLSPIFAVSPYLMKTRNTSQNFIEDHIEVAEIDRYIAQKRREGMKQFGMLHVILAAYIRTCARYPGLNRFIAGQKIFTRDREIEINMTVKKEMTTNSPDSVIKVTFDPADTAEQVYFRFNEKIREVKDSPADTSFDILTKGFHLVPGLLLKALVFVIQGMDYFGLLPRFLTKLSPFHGSLYITSMASLGIPPIYHHLYDFGNVPVFCAIGKKRREYETQRDGSVVVRKYIDCNFVTDERIVDGFYFAAAMRYLHGIFQDPWQLDRLPDEVILDQD